MAAVAQIENPTGRIKCTNCPDADKTTYDAEELKKHNKECHELRKKNKSDSGKIPTPPVQSKLDKAIARNNAKKVKAFKAAAKATEERMARLDRIR